MLYLLADESDSANVENMWRDMIYDCKTWTNEKELWKNIYVVQMLVLWSFSLVEVHLRISIHIVQACTLEMQL